MMWTRILRPIPDRSPPIAGCKVSDQQERESKEPGKSRAEPPAEPLRLSEGPVLGHAKGPEGEDHDEEKSFGHDLLRP